jgi:hypothetical protein
VNESTVERKRILMAEDSNRTLMMEKVTSEGDPTS